MDLVSKSKQDAIELLNKLDIAIIERNIVYYSQQGNFDNVRLLIEAGVSANAFYYIEKDKKKWYYSPLYSAYTNNHLDIAELLIKNGANVNFNDNSNIIPTPINYAIEKNNADLLNFFIKNGADVNFNKKTDHELIPIFQSIKLKHYEIIEILIKNNVDLNIEGAIWGNVTPLIYAVNKCDEKAVSILLDNGADINMTANSNLETPLIIAIRKKNINIVKILIEKGADINKKRKDGYSPMFLAHQRKLSEILQLLIKAGATPLTESQLKESGSVSLKHYYESFIDFLKINHWAKISLWIFLGLIILLLLGKGCSSCNKGSHSSSSSSESNSASSNDRPTNPVVKTDYGTLSDGSTTMDDYYIDNTGNKVWHGRRITNYPSGKKRMEAFYEYGEEKGYVKYDEAGNVIIDTRK
ncbi:MAG: ankyrin repeat domain-containing protein [Bacteroidota bacterium]